MVSIAWAKLPLTLLLTLQAQLSYAAPLTTEFIGVESTSRQTYIQNAIVAANALNQEWYDMENGLWAGRWWQSANFLTTMADMTELNPGEFMPVSNYYFNNCVEKAREHNGGNFHNDFYDDMGWWAVAFIRMFDVTKEKRYLDSAENIFEDMTSGRDAVCGGVWWSKSEDYIASIANELYLNVAAALGNRVLTREDHYRGMALENANWFLKSGLINDDDTVDDGIDPDTCEPTGTVFTYNSGVILGALAELHKLTSDDQYINTAHRIARGAMEHLVDEHGILTEHGAGAIDDLDPTAAMFKGAFVRNLKYLHRASPKSEYVEFLQKNADVMWREDRIKGGMIGANWQGKNHEATSSSQGAGFDVLVAAAVVTER